MGLEAEGLQGRLYLEAPGTGHLQETGHSRDAEGKHLAGQWLLEDHVVQEGQDLLGGVDLHTRV